MTDTAAPTAAPTAYPLRNNDRVYLYSDPLGRTHLEGVGTLLYRVNRSRQPDRDDALEFWWVLVGGIRRQRLVRASDRVTEPQPTQ